MGHRATSTRVLGADLPRGAMSMTRKEPQSTGEANLISTCPIGKVWEEDLISWWREAHGAETRGARKRSVPSQLVSEETEEMQAQRGTRPRGTLQLPGVPHSS